MNGGVDGRDVDQVGISGNFCLVFVVGISCSEHLDAGNELGGSRDAVVNIPISIFGPTVCTFSSHRPMLCLALCTCLHKHPGRNTLRVRMEQSRNPFIATL